MDRDLALIAACSLLVFAVCAARFWWRSPEDDDEEDDELDDPGCVANQNGRMP